MSKQVLAPVAIFTLISDDAFGIGTETHRIFVGGRIESHRVGEGEFGAWDVTAELSYDAVCLPSLLRRYRREGWEEVRPAA